MIARSGLETPRRVDVAELRHTVAGELIKLLSVRSTAIALAATAVLVIGFGALMTAGIAFQVVPPLEESGAPVMSAVDAPLGAVTIGFYAVAALGVLAVSGEYSTATIRSTLAAVPRRGRLVAAKAIAVAVLTLAATLPAVLVAHVIGRHILEAGGVAAPLPAGDAVRVVIGASLYLTTVALVGSAFGWLLRSTSGALTALIGLLVIVPALAPVLPAPVGERVALVLPDAGAAIFQGAPHIDPWAGLAVFAAYAGALLLLAVRQIRRRDA